MTTDRARIVEVVYDLPYRLDDGIKRLEEAGIVVRALNEGDGT